MSRTFDITTNNGTKDAIRFLEKKLSDNSAIARSLDNLPRPLNNMAKSCLASSIMVELGLRRLYKLLSTEKLLALQRQTAVALIREGKAQAVEEMTITMSEKAGLSLGSEVDGIPVDCTLGKAGKIYMHVKYR